MFMGKPVIATRVGGIPELVEDGRSGLLVPPGDPSALASGIATLLEDSELRTRLSQTGKMRVISEFSSSATARRVEVAYSKALSTRKHS